MTIKLITNNNVLNKPVPRGFSYFDCELNMPIPVHQKLVSINVVCHCADQTNIWSV